MRYMKAADVLPPDLLKQIQTYIDGEYQMCIRDRSCIGAAKSTYTVPI